MDKIMQALNNVKDSISELFSLDELKRVMETSEYDFSNFRTEILKFIKFGKRNGLNDLVCAQITIKKKEKDEYNAIVEVYFRDDKGNPQKVGKQYAIHGFSYIPESVSDGIAEKGEEKITFFIEDLKEMIEDKDLKISTYKGEMMNTLKKYAKENCLTDDECLFLNITNYVLYYRVIVSILQKEDEKGRYIGEFLVTHLQGLSEEDLKKLDENNELSIMYNVK